MRPGRDLVLATVLDSSHDIKVGGPCSLHYCPVFPGKQSSRSLSARRSPQLAPVTLHGGVGSRCPPARAIVRAVTATKHEPGLSPSYRVVSYGSAMEVRALHGEVVSLPACTRRSICCGAAPAQARPQQSTVLCCAQRTEQPSQIQNQSDFRATQRIGPTNKPLPSRPQKISSPLVPSPRK